jgi:hypothetical protein
MKQSHIAWKLLLAGTLSCQVACTADGAESMQIIRNQLPGEGCEISTTESGAYQPRGRIDVSSVNGYRFTPLVKSFAVIPENENTLRRIFVEGANVDIVFQGSNQPTLGAGLENSINFRAPFSGSIEAGGSTAFDFDIVTRELLADLVDDVTPESPVQIQASITVVGELDGDGIESNTFKYPVEVCDGCMTNQLGPCLGLSDEVEYSTGGVCNTKQDGALDCCTAEDGSLTCPAVAIPIPDPV